MANPSTLGAKIKNPNYNDQVKEEEKNKKNATKPHSKQRECVRKKTYSLARTIHIPHTPHQAMQHKSPKIYIVMSPKFTLPIFKQLNNLK